MKKTILILIILSFVDVCLAASIQDMHKMVIARKNAAGGNWCPVGTYVFYWDGEHPDGTGYACINDGESTVNVNSTNGTAAIHADYNLGSEGSEAGIQLDSNGDWIDWLVANSNVDDQGTIRHLAYYTEDMGSTNCNGAAAVGDTSNWAQTMQRSLGSQLEGHFQGNGGTVDIVEGSTGWSSSTTYTVCYTWRNDGTDKHCVIYLEGDVACNFAGADCETETLDDWTTPMARVAIGDFGPLYCTNTSYYDEIEVREGYEGP